MNQNNIFELHTTNINTHKNLRYTCFGGAQLKIKVISLGELGSTTINKMTSIQEQDNMLQNLDIQFINFDKYLTPLTYSAIKPEDWLGVTQQIRNDLKGTDVIYVTYNLDYKYINKSIALARIIAKLNILTVAIINSPYLSQSNLIENLALETRLNELNMYVDSIILAPSSSALADEASSSIPEIIFNLIRASETPGLISLFSHDIGTVLSGGGFGLAVTENSFDGDYVLNCFSNALRSLMLGVDDLSNVKGVLVLISSHSGCTDLDQYGLIREDMEDLISPDANFYCAMVENKSLTKNETQVTIYLTRLNAI